MPRVSPETFKRLQSDPSCIRNICIVAHVDHGKTSLSDSLLASNGIISQKLAGKVRFLDSRPDEQLRGITMESSAISLYFRLLHKQENSDEPLVNEHLINLIDSPGHIDFSSEVSTASRLCDGAIVLVDVVEGVCSQTITVLRQCWTEKLKPILVLNKIDRLISELQLSPVEAYLHLSKIIEQVNSIIGSFFAGQRQLDDFSYREKLKLDKDLKFEDSDDSDLYFDPIKNNVIFASAIDGWGFNISQFAKFYQSKLGAKREVLQKILWGDYYMDPKTKKILNNKSLKGRNLKPMFVSLILDNIWKIYENVVQSEERNMEMIEKIIKALDIKLLPRDLRSRDNKQLLRNIMGQWIPVSTSVLLSVIENLPSPLESQSKRLDTILGPNVDVEKVDKQVLESMNSCDKDGPVVAYVSKILSIPREELPIESLSNGDQTVNARVEALRAAKRAEMIEKMSKMRVKNDENTGGLYERATDSVQTPEIELSKDKKSSSSVHHFKDTTNIEKFHTTSNDDFLVVNEPTPAFDLGFEYEEEEDINFETDNNFNIDTENDNSTLDFVPDSLDPNDPLNAMFEYEDESEFNLDGTYPQSVEEEEENDIFAEKDEVLIGFSRIYSGTLKVGQTVSILGPKYDPRKPNEHIQSTTITHMYLFMGRELVPLDECPAGNIVGIRGLAGKVLKNATIVSPDIEGVNLASVNFQSSPIVRVALEPINPMQMNSLVRGLKLLNQADPCVSTYVSDNGENILCTAGELHLERCLKDLRERFAGIEITSSPPAIPYRETFLNAPDMNPVKNPELGRGYSYINLSKTRIKIKVCQLPDEVTQFLDKHQNDIKTILHEENVEVDPSASIGVTEIDRNTFITKLKELLEKYGADDPIFKDPEFVSKIAVFGPNRIGCNILISKNNILHSVFIDNENFNKYDKFEYGESIINGFELSTHEGPLAKEPVQGMCVSIEEVTEMTEEELFELQENDASYQREIADFSGRLITSTRDTIHNCFLDWSPRIMWAIYTCDIQTSVEVLGKVYAVVQQRRGVIVSEEMKEGTPFFQIQAHIPVVEAFGFSEDIRKKTSGAAQPQLVFAGFECIDLDPFWVPTTIEELEDLGDTADKENIARKHMNAIRKRKGLFVDEKVIQNAEKQRTLKKN